MVVSIGLLRRATGSIEEGICPCNKAQSGFSGCEGPQPSRRWHPSKQTWKSHEMLLRVL